jgi:hypothetical protein
LIGLWTVALLRLGDYELLQMPELKNLLVVMVTSQGLIDFALWCAANWQELRQVVLTLRVGRYEQLHTWRC